MIYVAAIDNVAAMSEASERLRLAREAKFRTAGAAAEALGMSASSYRAHENGQNNFDFDQAVIYGKKFGVDPIFLLTGNTNSVGENHTNDRISESPNAVIRGRLEGQGKMIPVYGRAVGGLDGEFEMNGSILYHVMAPPTLAEHKGAYAVQVSGDSMSPRYEDGEVCFIDPTRRVKKGDYVIVQIKTEDEGMLLAYVKKFCRHNAAELVLEQFNPPKELRFEARSVVSVHYIALAGNA
jgi:phage repressor protein C with HTH and peptisase S24 domain